MMILNPRCFKKTFEIFETKMNIEKIVYSNVSVD